MLKHITFYALFACLFQGYLFLDRNDIIADYQPLLTERANNYTATYNSAVTETTLALEEIKNQTWDSIAFMNTQIASIKQTIANAKNVSAIANNTAAVACLTVQETAASTLSSVAINSTCYLNATYPDLVSARDSLATLAAIPNSTVAACASLNPLPSQDELFLDCITHKILDLDQMFDILTANFALVRTQTFNTSVECLADQTSLIAEQIVEINFRVTACVI